MADWYRVPLWCHGRDRREEAAVAVYVLGEWHVGRAPSPLEVKTEFGWGWSRAAKFIDALWGWAGEANALRPPAPRDGVKASKTPSGEKPGSDRGVSGERSGSDDGVTKRIVEHDRGAIGESAGSDRGVSRARSSLERDEDERRDPFAPAHAAAAASRQVVIDVTPSTPTPPEKPTRKPKPTKAKPEHAQDVIAAWCEVFKEANGAPYPVNGREVGTLARLAADYVTGEEWEAKRDVLRSGMAAYVKDPQRFPPGAPTVGGFAQDPARWMQATAAPTATKAGRRASFAELFKAGAAAAPIRVNVTPGSQP